MPPKKRQRRGFPGLPGTPIRTFGGQRRVKVWHFRHKAPILFIPYIKSVNIIIDPYDRYLVAAKIWRCGSGGCHGRVLSDLPPYICTLLATRAVDNIFIVPLPMGNTAGQIRYSETWKRSTKWTFPCCLVMSPILRVSQKSANGWSFPDPTQAKVIPYQ